VSEVELTAEDVLARVEVLAREVEQREQALDEALATANAMGVSQRDLAEALGTSKSSVNRRLSGARPSVSVACPFDEDEAGEEREFRRAMREQRLQRAKLQVAETSVKLRLRQDAAAAIEEANALTRIGPLDVYDLGDDE
jgi:transcriptional regulator with XRE-family HTH domain